MEDGIKLKIHKNRIDWQDKLTDCHDPLCNIECEIILHNIRKYADWLYWNAEVREK